MSESQEALRQVIQNVAASVVGDEGAVVVQFTNDDKGVHYTVDCNPADARFLIGKQGSMANAIRAVARAVGQKHKFDATVTFNVPERERSTTSSNAPAAVAA